MRKTKGEIMKGTLRDKFRNYKEEEKLKEK